MITRIARSVMLVGLPAAILALVSYVFANSLLVASSNLSDAVVQSPVTANDLKPPQCAGLTLTNLVVSSGAFFGTDENDLILGSPGLDTIDGMGGNDCIVGGGDGDVLFGGGSSGSETVRDNFNVISYSNNNGSQDWNGNWSEIGESDGPVYGDVNVEVSLGRGLYTIYADQDSHIEERNPANNYGSASETKVRTTSGDQKRALYRFNLASLPVGANVLSARAYFYVTTSNNNPVNVHRVTASWVESTVTWNTIASSFEGSSSGSFSPASNNQYISVDITALAQRWLNGSAPNHGLMLLSTVTTETRYATKEEAGTNRDPFIVVEISQGGGANTVYAFQDGHVEEKNPNNNYGSTNELKVRATSGDQKRGLFQYNLSTLPTGVNVALARAYFYVTTSNSNPVNVHRVTNSWLETSATWNNIASAFASPASGSFMPGTNNQYTTVEITSLVQQWLNGTSPNYGLMLVATVNNETRYSTREAAGTSEDPYLTVSFSPGGSFQALRIRNVSRGASRAVSLCTATSATLSFKYLRRELDDANDSVSVQISSNGGTSWNTLGTIAGPTNDTAMQSLSYNINAYMSCNTVIRFLSSPSLGASDFIYIDDIQISYMDVTSTGGNDVLIGGPGDDSLDGGGGTDTCYGGPGVNTFSNCETIYDP